MAGFSFRVTVGPGNEFTIPEVDGTVPPGVYQVSGHDNTAEPGSPSEQKSVSIIQHDQAGTVVVGCSGYVGS